jgi:hypothetical protein
MRLLVIPKSERAIQEQNQDLLRAASDGAEAQLREFLSHLKKDLIYVSQGEQVRDKLYGASL